MRPAIVTLVEHDRPTGVAALVDDSGYFVTHSSSVAGRTAWGITSTGKQLTFHVVAQDRASMLVLLKTGDWDTEAARPFHSPSDEDLASGQLIAVLPSGPLRMAYGSRHKLGVLDPSRRLVPLTEIRFESAPRSIGGALLFTESGGLIGSLNATLEGVNSDRQAQQVRDFNPTQFQNPGPGPMSVGYTVSPDFVRHVLDGFLSPSHKVEFPVLGVFCTDAVGGGALIQQVTPGSPADKAGLHAGDILLNIASNPVQDQMAFASIMLQQKPGKKIQIVVQHGEAKLLLDIVPGSAAD